MPLEGKNIGFRYTEKSPWVLQGVSLAVHKGERVGIIAPSGYGKTTLVKLLSGYETPTQGEIVLNHTPLPKKGLCPVQLISQHPEQAINPRWKLRRALEEAGQLRQEVIQAMGIEPDWLERYPLELSGGELQRFCVARALTKGVQYLIADEMSTMLDVITAAQIWNFLLEEVKKREIGLVVVTHNPHLAEKVCTRTIYLPDINQIPTPLDP